MNYFETPAARSSRKLMRPILLSLVVLLVPAAAHAERLRYRFRTGQTIEYRANLAGATMLGQTGGQMARMQFRMTARQLQRVRSLSGGTVVLDVVESTLSGKMTMSGKTEPMDRAPNRSVVRMTERGRFLDRKGQGEPGEEAGASGIDGADVLFGLNFPDRDVKPGDTWQDTFEIGSKAAPQRVRGTWKYVAREVFRGRPCAKITTVLSMPMTGGDTELGVGLSERGKMSATMTTYFDPKEGIEIYSSGSLVTTSKADLTSLSPEAGELANVTKINLIQWYVPKKKGPGESQLSIPGSVRVLGEQYGRAK